MPPSLLEMSPLMGYFSCCVAQRPPRKRRRIDLSMIGNPTDFKHTGHIGAGDMCNTTYDLGVVQSQMQSKGGFEHSTPVAIQLNVIDLQDTSAKS